MPRTALASFATVALALIIAPTAASAATYYVAANGSDTADGSSGTPWGTIQHAADSAGPGDTVIVRAGDYAGFEISTSGTDDAHRVIVRAEGTVNITSPAGTGDGIRITDSSFVTVQGFHLANLPNLGIAARGATPDTPMHGVQILDNVIDSCGDVGIYASEIADSLVQGNTVSNTNQQGPIGGHGMYLANAGSDRTVIRGNTFVNNTNGIHFNGDSSVGGDGIISGLTVEGNVLHDNTANGFNMDGVQDSLIQNNLLYDNGRHALRAYAIDAAQGPKNLIIVNNTMVVGAAGTGWCVKLTEDEGGSVVFDNVLLNESDGHGSISLTAPPSFASAHNAVVDLFSADGEDTTVTLTEWQAMGYDVGSFVATRAQLFASASDYHLGASSPALDTGVAMLGGHNAPATDLEGTARPQGAGIDVGAFERCGGAMCNAGTDAGAASDGGGGRDAAVTRDASNGVDARSGGDAGEGVYDGSGSDAGGGDGGTAMAPRGCGCRAAGESGESGTLSMLGGLVAMMALRRRRTRGDTPRGGVRRVAEPRSDSERAA